VAFQRRSVVKKIRGLLGSYKEGGKKEKKERILENKTKQNTIIAMPL